MDGLDPFRVPGEGTRLTIADAHATHVCAPVTDGLVWAPLHLAICLHQIVQ